MSTYFTSGFVAIALAVWFSLAAFAQTGQGVPPPNPLPPPKAPAVEPKRPIAPPKAGDPIREKRLDGLEINERLKEAREGRPTEVREERREAREDLKARAEAQQKADEARARAARTREGVETPRDRAQDARVRAQVSNDQGLDRRGDQNYFNAAAIRSADIGLWFDRANRDQLVVSDVGTTGPISKFGFREGDRIISVAGHRVVSQPDFLEYLFAEDLRAQRVEVVVYRDGKEHVVWVEPNALVDGYHQVDNDPLEHFGVILDDRYDDRIVVWRVIPQSPAFYAGIRAGDTLVTYRGDKLAGRTAFLRTMQTLQAGDVDVQVRRDNRLRDFRVEVPAFVARTDRRQNYLKPDVERLNERREARIEDRREDRRDRADVQPGLPGVTPIPAPNVELKVLPRP